MGIFRLFITTLVTCLFYINCLSMNPVEEFKKDIHHIREDFGHARKDIGTIISVVAPGIGEAIRGELPKAITKNPYKNKDAHVRRGADISKKEKKYLSERLAINKASIETLLKRNIEDHQVPKIAIGCSGGGYRAMLATTGFLAGAEKIGTEKTNLLGATRDIAGLSGSTGAILSWIATQQSLTEFKDYIKNCAAKSFIHPTDEEELLIYDAAAVRSHFKQQHEAPFVLYGDLIGNAVLKKFGKKRHMIYLSHLATIIEDGSYPYPICTAIDATETQEAMLNPTWYGFTPHKIKNYRDNLDIPTWAFGREFENGTSHKGEFDIYPPEKNLSYILGTCWSAFGAPFHLIKKELGKTLGVDLENILTSLDAQRLDFYAKVPNYTYKLDEHKLHESKTQSFVDAGTAFNIPTPAIHDANIMIICDASAGKIGNELEKAMEYMHNNKLPFPKINFDNIDKKTISIFKEEDPNVPVVIYLPRISDKNLWEKHKSNPKYAHYDLDGFDFEYETNHKDGFAQTIHFQYEPENAQKIMDQMEFNIRVNEAKIIKAIEFAVNRKKMQ